MKAFLLSLSLLSAITIAHAQDATTSAASPLQDQFERLKRNANSYKEYNRPYKVIEVRKLDLFWESVQTTLKNQEQKLLNAGKTTEAGLQQAQATIAEQQNQIAALKKENALKEQAAQQNAYEVANLDVFGLGINKQVYLFLSLGIIVALSIGLSFIYSLYQKSKKVSDEKVDAFQAIDQEFNEYKKTARERELKVKRELQTEMNKKEELKQQLAMLQK